MDDRELEQRFEDISNMFHAEMEFSDQLVEIILKLTDFLELTENEQEIVESLQMHREFLEQEGEI